MLYQVRRSVIIETLRSRKRASFPSECKLGATRLTDTDFSQLEVHFMAVFRTKVHNPETLPREAAIALDAQGCEVFDRVVQVSDVVSDSGDVRNSAKGNPIPGCRIIREGHKKNDPKRAANRSNLPLWQHVRDEQDVYAPAQPADGATDLFGGGDVHTSDL